jgi:hypothetical protein
MIDDLEELVEWNRAKYIKEREEATEAALMSLVTLGRSDAILVSDILKIYLNEVEGFDTPTEYDEGVRNLLEFIEIQLNSIAEEAD